MESSGPLQREHVVSDAYPVQKAERTMHDHCTMFNERVSAPMLAFLAYTNVNGKSLEIYQADVNHNSLNLKDAYTFVNHALGDPIGLNTDQLSHPTDDFQVLVAYDSFCDNSEVVSSKNLPMHKFPQIVSNLFTCPVSA